MLALHNFHTRNHYCSDLLSSGHWPCCLSFPVSRALGFLMASANIVAEYAKSNRSSCKKCSKSIPLGSLRLGVIRRDARGFDATSWHHLDCFPRGSQPSFESEKIKGFSSLKNDDQVSLRRKLDFKCDESRKEVSKAGVGDGGRDEIYETDEVEERGSKKSKLSGSGTEKDIIVSSSDVKKNYKDATLPPKWKAFQTLIFLERDDGLHDSEKIAAFDFDGCLANTSVKRVGADAWSLMYPSIPEKLQSLYNCGYKLVIFTNESNIERWKNKRQQAVDSKIGRLDNFIKRTNVPIQVFIACDFGNKNGQNDDPFRKPKPGMWHLMERHFNSGIAIDMDRSFYVGDAAGRANDHSDSDIAFAKAIGLKFYVPEDYFGA